MNTDQRSCGASVTNLYMSAHASKIMIPQRTSYVNKYFMNLKDVCNLRMLLKKPRARHGISPISSTIKIHILLIFSPLYDKI